MSVLKKIRHSPWFDTIYRISIGIKGFDGLVELVAGLIMVFSPQTPHVLLMRAADFFADKDTNFFTWLADVVFKFDADLTGQTTLFIIIFLLSHGIIKLVLVYCLLKRFYRVYPYAIVVLLLMLVAQLWPLVRDPTSVAMWFMTVLNALIIYVVWAEYLDLREEVRAGRKPSEISEKTV